MSSYAKEYNLETIHLIFKNIQTIKLNKGVFPSKLFNKEHSSAAFAIYWQLQVIMQQALLSKWKAICKITN